jgi:hypothetical protein
VGAMVPPLARSGSQQTNPRETMDSPLESPLGQHRDKDHRKSVGTHQVMTVNEMCASPQGPPLDYSFLEIRMVEELREVLPRSGYRKAPPDFLEDESGQQIPNPIKDDWVAAPNPNMRTEALKMGNNFLAAIPPAFNIIIREIIDRPRNLSWIDLSFNLLEEVPSVLSSYTNLNVSVLNASNGSPPPLVED